MYININHYHENRFTSSNILSGMLQRSFIRLDREVTTILLVVVGFDDSARPRSYIETDISDHE